MWQLLISATLLAIPLDVRVETLDGKTFSGSLVQLQSDKLTISVDAHEKTIPASGLLAVTVQKPLAASEEKPSAWIELFGGSRVAATHFVESSGTAEITLPGGERVDIPTRSIRWVRFPSSQDAVQQQWAAITGQRVSGDMLVLRRQGPNLDFLEGTVIRIGPETVRFRFDDETVDVPREKLEGVVYYAPTVEELPPSICQVYDVRGSLWSASRMQLVGEQLQLNTATDVIVTLTLRYVEKMDFSRGNIVYLSDLEPQRVTWTSYLPSAAISDQLAQMFQPRRDASFGGGKLRLTFNQGGARTDEFDKGLAIHSRTETVFRLPEGFQRFRAIAGIDARVRDAGSVVLEVSGDGNPLFKATVTGHDEPLAIDIPIEGVRRLRILVDFADDLAIADQLDLCNARITK